ncbi:hypothetical protein M758_7G142600 [Ceratodon purpureus]|uniref:DUF7748 domain-containing protein n=1 Tax=Ceratodon purpureus TaxID=3225 RepID=A0A8T0H882_CERPU|nr:hypothetical protein KC19_7G135500 [Ceratodon purpureus]KAG0611456.1 hypothetical protein M758_7G142600 [Ceratodon purpureus]
MGRSKTKVINNTGSPVNLTMSTGGIQSRESTEPVRDQFHYTISIDPNATYREYWCAVQPGNKGKVILSSDDCAEYSEVTLVEKNGKYAWEGTKLRDSRRAKSLNAGAAPQATPPQAPIVNAAGGASQSSSTKARPSRCTIS